ARFTLARVLARHIWKPFSLTAREVQVMELVAVGLRNKEIATSLHISEETVGVHIRNIFAKLDVNDRSAAIAISLRRGILHLRWLLALGKFDEGPLRDIGGVHVASRIRRATFGAVSLGIG